MAEKEYVYFPGCSLEASAIEYDLSVRKVLGALGVKLGGGAFYQGRWISRPEIGEEKRKINAALINEALKISFLTSFLMLLIGMGVKWLS